MDFATRLIGALIITYFVRLAVLYGFSVDQRRAWQLFMANCASAFICALTAGFVKSAFTVFKEKAATIYFAAQILWFVFDIWLSRSGPAKAT